MTRFCWLSITGILMILIIILSGCSGTAATATPSASAPATTSATVNTATTTAAASPSISASNTGDPLKVGALSMITVLPLYVAQQEGLFQAQGLNVQIVPFRSQVERDNALVAGQLDCVIEDIYSAPIFNKNGPTIKITAVSPVKGYMFAIIAAKDSNINTVADLTNTEIASSLGNIIEYATDQLCAAGGLTPDQVQKTSVPSMPLRLEMLNQGKIAAATFSRPLSDTALLDGGRLICDDSQQSLLASSILFSTGFINNRPDDIKKFLKAWSEAADHIAANPDSYRSQLVSVASISAALADKIEVPSFGEPRLPTAEEYQSKMDWNLEKGNLSQSIPYSDIVATGFLP